MSGVLIAALLNSCQHLKEAILALLLNPAISLAAVSWGFPCGDLAVGDGWWSLAGLLVVAVEPACFAEVDTPPTMFRGSWKVNNGSDDIGRPSKLGIPPQ